MPGYACPVIVLCLPMRTGLWSRVMSAVDHLALVGLPDTALLALHPFSATPFMARDPASLAESNPQALLTRPAAAGDTESKGS